MGTQVVLLPEEEELARLQARLRELEDELAERELALSTLQRELNDLLARYLGIVGLRLAELDRLEAELAALLAVREPSPQAEERAQQADQQAQDSAQALGDDREALAEAAATPPRETPEELKSLYRKVAKAVHPDLALDATERATRGRLMAEANRAYQEGDQEALQAILGGWSARPESVSGDGVGAKLVRTIRAVAAIEERLAAIAEEMAALQATDLCTLREQEHDAREAGRDLLQEMAAELDARIAEVKEALRDPSAEAAS